MQYFHLNSIGKIIDIENNFEIDSLKIPEFIKILNSFFPNLNSNSRVILSFNNNCFFFIFLFFAMLKNANIFIISSKLTKFELSNIQSFVKPTHFFTDNKNSHFNNLYNKILIKFKKTKNPIKQKLKIKANKNRYIILFTSGTTGTPKGVMLSYYNLFSRINANKKFINFSKIQNVLVTLQLSFGHGLIGNALTPLFSKKNIFLINLNNAQYLNIFSEIIKKNKINFFCTVPTQMNQIMMFSKKINNSNLKLIHIGSAPVSLNLLNKITKWANIKNIFNMYGITETSNWIAGKKYNKRNKIDFNVGKAWTGKIKVMDNNKIKSSGFGEILIKSNSVFTKYFKLPNTTKNSFTNGFFKTGDYGLIKNNNLYLGGRKKYMINKGGQKIFPEEIDNFLLKSSLVKDCCAFKIPNILYGEDLAVAIVLNSRNKNKAIEKLKKYCIRSLSKYKIPAEWFVTDYIEKNDRGKVSRDNISKKFIKL